jgi:sugar phosphate isomerase/epimerase
MAIIPARSCSEAWPRVFFEVDTYWAKAAGQDPARIIGQLAKRVPLMHIKDGPGDKTSPMVAVGTGVQDIKEASSARRRTRSSGWLSSLTPAPPTSSSRSRKVTDT